VTGEASKPLDRRTALRSSPLVELTSLLLCGVLVIGLIRAVLALPDSGPRLAPVVESHMASSGVQNPVTAVLLNFRGYDTLFEIGVLWLAVLGARVLTRRDDPRHFGLLVPSPIFLGMLRVVVPLTVLVSGYLLLVGATAPGGAFQAGAILGAGLILIHLYDDRLTAVRPRVERAGLTVGLLIFAFIGLGAVPAGRPMLTYPPGLAAILIFVIEAAAMVSIAMILVSLYAGGRVSRPCDADAAEPS
jgi:multisubunit Na+/H+ antiporter MnhB subunit